MGEDMEDNDDEEDKSDKDDSAASSPDKNEDQSQSPKGETETEEGSPKPAKKKKGGEAIDLTKLDNESIEIMAMLMLYCIKNEITAHKVFEDVLFLQNIKSKSKHQTVEIMKATDFYKVLADCQIRQGEESHENL